MRQWFLKSNLFISKIVSKIVASFQKFTGSLTEIQEQFDLILEETETFNEMRDQKYQTKGGMKLSKEE